MWTITHPDIDSKFVPSGKSDDNYNTENIDEIISSLENLKFEAVINPSLTNTYTGLDNPYIVKIESFDNQTWQIYIGNQTKDTRYVKIKNSNTSDKNWIYLVTQNRITPLIQPYKELLKKDKKPPELMNKTYSSPIS